VSKCEALASQHQPGNRRSCIRSVAFGIVCASAWRRRLLWRQGAWYEIQAPYPDDEQGVAAPTARNYVETLSRYHANRASNSVESLQQAHYPTVDTPQRTVHCTLYIIWWMTILLSGSPPLRSAFT